MAAILFGLFVLSIQCFAVQTHIHPAVNGAVPHVGWSDLAAGSDRPAQQSELAGGTLNPADDPTKCLLCWEAVHGGHFVSPVTALIVPSSLQSFAAFFPEASSHAVAASHNWRVRAPPPV
jgi:hypothetical protein